MYSKLRPSGNRIPISKNPLSESALLQYQFSLFGSGTAALAAAIIAARKNLESVEEPNVLVPGYTCPDVLSACQFAGVKVKLIDFEPNCPWMNLELLRQAIDDQTVAIIAVNFLGIPERVEQIRECLAGRPILIIEDSAQAIPVPLKKPYWKGDLVVLSFGRGKPVSLLTGGMVLSPDPRIMSLLPKDKAQASSNSYILWRIKIALFHMLSHRYLYYWIAKLPFLKLGETRYKPLTQLQNAPNFLRPFIMNAISHYQKLVEPVTDIISEYQHIDKAHYYPLWDDGYHSQYGFPLRYPILVSNNKRRHHITEALHPYGTSRMYGQPLTDFSGVPHGLISVPFALKNCSLFAKQLVTLPCYSDLPITQIRKLVRIINEFKTTNA